MAATLFGSCSEGPGVLSYDKACDIDLSGWHAEDTLVYDIDIAEQPTPRQLLRLNTPYHIRFGVRHNNKMRLRELPLSIIVQEVDTTGGQRRLHHTMRHIHANLPLRTEHGRIRGKGWAATYQLCSGANPDVVLNFERQGNYRLLIMPDIEAATSLPGLSALMVELRSE